MLFRAACRILCSEDLALKFNEQAAIYLSTFVRLSERYYGIQCQILNMHSLIHLADDVKSMGCSLSKVTAFPFENTLGKIKKMIRNGKRLLSQISRRFHEIFVANAHKIVAIPLAVTILSKRLAESEEYTVIKKLRYKSSILTSNSPNNVVLLRNNQILYINVMYIPHHSHQNTVQIAGQLLIQEKPIFKYPCNSKMLKMWKVKKTDVEKKCALQDIVLKMVCLKINDSERQKICVMPLLHE